MKNIFILIAIACFFSCKAQSIIKPMGENDFCRKNPDCYEKDINNEFGKFVGEWKYQSGTTEITIKLKKEEHYRISDETNYEDLLVGEYKFVENGMVIDNTLADFDDDTISGYDHNISGGVFVHFLPGYCIDNSQSQEIKIELFINDPNVDKIEGRIILRYVNDNGIEKLETCIYDYTTMADDENAKLAIPDGYYEFEKQ
jgi:hypothetical protein